MKEAGHSLELSRAARRATTMLDEAKSLVGLLVLLSPTTAFGDDAIRRLAKN
jgi:hypothetical protein